MLFNNNSYDQFNRQQNPNQFNSGNQTDPNANTRWMMPSMMQPQNGLQGQTMSRPLATSGNQVNQNIGKPASSGTAIDSVLNGGGYNGNTGFSGLGGDWSSPQSAQPQAITSSQPATNQSINLPGWMSNRTDNDPKQVMGQFAQNWMAQGKQWGADGVRAFVAQDPRWEINPNSSPNDPQIRVKQDVLNGWKPGTSTWQDVIRDSGPGGANAPQFNNAIGDPSMGYASPDMSMGSPQSVLGTGVDSTQAGLTQLIQRLFQQVQNQRSLMPVNRAANQNYNMPTVSPLGLQTT